MVSAAAERRCPKSWTWWDFGYSPVMIDGVATLVHVACETLSRNRALFAAIFARCGAVSRLYPYIERWSLRKVSHMIRITPCGAGIEPSPAVRMDAGGPVRARITGAPQNPIMRS